MNNMSSSEEILPVEAASKSTLPLAAIALPLVAAQFMGTRHMRSQVMKLLRDPHCWLPWKNRNPWRNPTSQWWWNAKPWLNNEVRILSSVASRMLLLFTFGSHTRALSPRCLSSLRLTSYFMLQPWKNPKPWDPTKTNRFF